MRHVQTLRAVTLIARLGSIRKAAEALHIVPSALTRQLQDLEGEIGAALFERKARGMRLTAAGELFVRYSRTAVHDLDLVRSQIEDLKGLRGGTVAMSAIEAVATTVLPQAIADFRKRNPRVRFEVHVMGADQVVRSVEADEADIGITFNPAPSRGLRVLAEFAQELYAIMSDAHPLARRQSIRLRDCQGYPLLLDQFLMRSSLHLEPVLVSNSVEMLKSVARSSEAICFQIGVGAPARGAGLKAIALADAGLRSGKLIVGARRGRVLPVAAAVFTEQLKKQLAQG